MTEDDIDEASTLIPALLDRLNGTWRRWKRREDIEAPMFDKVLLPGDPCEASRGRGIRIRVKRRMEPRLATGEEITVFIRAAVLWALGGYKHPADFGVSKAELNMHRSRIEEVASEKYRAQGV